MFLSSLQQNFVKIFTNCIISLIFTNFSNKFFKKLYICNLLTKFYMTLSPNSYLLKIILLDAEKLNYKSLGTNKLFTNQRAVEQLKKFASSQWSAKWPCLRHWWFADWSSLLREPLILWMVIGLSTDPSSQGKRKSSMIEPQIWSQEFRGSSFPHVHPLPPSFAFLQVGSLSWVLALKDVR